MSAVLFLDTEYNSHTHELAQLSCILVRDGCVTTQNHYFRVESMDEDSTRIHGLTKEWLDAHGADRAAAKQDILRDFDGATLVAHNLNADKHVLELAFGELPHAFGMCTMYRFAKTLKLPGGHPYKMPSLRELMAHYHISDEAVTAQAADLFHDTLRPHDARWDATAVYLCTLQAIARGDCRDLFSSTGE